MIELFTSLYGNIRYFESRKSIANYNKKYNYNLIVNYRIVL